MTLKEGAPPGEQRLIRVKVNHIIKLFFVFLAALLTKKEPREPEPEPKRVFGPDGLPRIKPKLKGNMPEYARGNGMSKTEEEEGKP
jgi:hypothetical protein